MPRSSHKSKMFALQSQKKSREMQQEKCPHASGRSANDRCLSCGAQLPPLDDIEAERES